MLKQILIATTATLGFAGSALAHDGWRDRDEGWRHGHGWGHERYRHYYYAPRPVYVVPAPRIVYAPPPPVVYPYYAAPVVVRPTPVYPAPAVSVRFSFPL